MTISLDKIRDAVANAKAEARISGIDPEDIDAIAAALAVFDLMGFRTASVSPTTDVPTPISKLPQSFAEWASKYNLSTHYDRFLAITLYLYERGTMSVSTNEIHATYDKARWKRPANAADIFSKGAERMWFTETDDPKEENGPKLWRITQTGFEHLESLRLS